MSRKRDPKREALVARIETAEAKAAKALSGLKGKFTRYVALVDAVKRLRKQLREHDAAPLGNGLHGGNKPEGSAP